MLAVKIVPMMKMSGFGLSGYRSFMPDDLQLLSPLNRVNLLAGQNNTGKSNVSSPPDREYNVNTNLRELRSPRSQRRLCEILNKVLAGRAPACFDGQEPAPTRRAPGLWDFSLVDAGSLHV